MVFAADDHAVHWRLFPDVSKGRVTGPSPGRSPFPGMFPAAPWSSNSELSRLDTVRVDRFSLP